MDEQLEFERCVMVLLGVVLGLIIIMQFAIILKLGEIKREYMEQRRLTSALIDYNLAQGAKGKEK